MGRIKLFQPTKPGTLTLEEYDALSEVQELLALPERQATDPLMDVAQNTIEDIAGALDRAEPSIEALRETSMVIAPSISEARQSDIDLVRRIAEAASTATGMPVQELLGGEGDVLEVGKPLVLESFKTATINAMKRVWRFIMDILDAFVNVGEQIYMHFVDAQKKYRDAVKRLETMKGKVHAGERPTIPWQAQFRYLCDVPDSGFPEVNDLHVNTAALGLWVNSLRNPATIGRDLDFKTMIARSTVTAISDTPITIAYYADSVAKNLKKYQADHDAKIVGDDLVFESFCCQRIIYKNAAPFLTEKYKRLADNLEVGKTVAAIRFDHEGIEGEFPEALVVPELSNLADAMGPLNSFVATTVKDALRATKSINRGLVRKTLNNAEAEQLRWEQLAVKDGTGDFDGYVTLYPTLCRSAIQMTTLQDQYVRRLVNKWLGAMTAYINACVETV